MFLVLSHVYLTKQRKCRTYVATTETCLEQPRFSRLPSRPLSNNIILGVVFPNAGRHSRSWIKKKDRYYSCLFNETGERRTGRPNTPWTDTSKRVAGGEWLRADKNRSRYTQISKNQGYTFRRHNQRVTKPVYLVMQVPTYLTEAKFYYMFQMSVLYLPRITHLGIKLLSSK